MENTIRTEMFLEQKNSFIITFFNEKRLRPGNSYDTCDFDAWIRQKAEEFCKLLSIPAETLCWTNPELRKQFEQFIGYTKVLSNAVVEAMWAELKDIPIVKYSDGVFLDQDWLLFPDGTSRQELIDWFEVHHGRGVKWLQKNIVGADILLDAAPERRI